MASTLGERHAAVVLERDGDMGRVGDDDRRLRHVFHLAARRGHLALLGADLTLEHRIAFLLLVLFFDFLLATCARCG